MILHMQYIAHINLLACAHAWNREQCVNFKNVKKKIKNFSKILEKYL